MAKPELGYLDAERIKRGFERLSERLGEEGVRASVYIVGSAAMLFAHGLARTTEDVDLMYTGEVHHTRLLALAAEVAHDLGLPENWLNDDFRFVDPQPAQPQKDKRAATLFESPSLVVTGASLEHLLGMKVHSARDKDLDDIQFLVRKLQLHSMQEIEAVHERVYPGFGIPWRNRNRVEQCLERVWKRSDSDTEALDRQ